MIRVGIVIPTYGWFEYAREAIISALNETGRDVRVIVVDDGSPTYRSKGTEQLADLASDERVIFHPFEKNGGLTRGWNFGLRRLRDEGCTFICCANSDVLFSAQWDDALIQACQQDYALVGPITNAPGTEDHQCVTHFVPDYRLTDEQAAVNEVALRLRSQRHQARDASINGFCLFASTERWFEGAYDAEHVFCPRNDKNSKGQSNPTPLMTLNEYELQRRWRNKGWKIGFSPGSFVFHYRSVSRGPQYTRGLSYRRPA